mmetsp:Transcript_31320/g.28502  ORF Transcript_31320/g.28502 Transcript_31320/m.28502 type:complete len:170 (-) Transcript_31320:986-1495(-)
MKDEIKKVFIEFDTDKSGTIERNEVKNLAQKLGEKISDEEVDKIFRDIDTDKNNRISLDEFTTWWCYGKKNKMEKLVRFMLKAGNIAGRSKFIRNRISDVISGEGSSTEIQDFKGTVRVGYIEPKTWFDFKLLIGKEAEQIFKDLKGNIQANDDFAVVLRLQVAQGTNA